MKNILRIFIILGFISLPSISFSFDLIGWWHNKSSNTLMKITDKKFNGYDYRIISSSSRKIEVEILSKIGKTSYAEIVIIEKDSESSFKYINGFDKREYKLVTHDVKLPKSEVLKLSKQD